MLIIQRHHYKAIFVVLRAHEWHDIHKVWLSMVTNGCQWLISGLQGEFK